jgi:SAM-dependent methyltransferase
MAKDLFSSQSTEYAKFRPSYPPELFDYIVQFVEEKDKAWDCATGNGQAAVALASYFKKVVATDISEAQVRNASRLGNISYQVCAAEHTPFPDRSFNLVTVATAYHWLNWKEFAREVKRVGKEGAVVAVWAYHLITCEDLAIDRLIAHYYHDIMASYWDPERRHVEERYANVEFDFDPLPARDFDIPLHWKKEHFIGYLQTWSAFQNYIKKNGRSPIRVIEPELDAIWNDDSERVFHFPIFLKIGRV